MGVFGIILLVFFVIISLLLVTLVIVQNDNSQGLGGIFGGTSDTTFGTGSGNILTKVTYIVGGLFLVTALGLGYINRTPEDDSMLTQTQAAEQQDAAQWWTQGPAEEPTDSE
jgi:preprotein translocase subunit SecG